MQHDERNEYTYDTGYVEAKSDANRDQPVLLDIAFRQNDEETKVMMGTGFTAVILECDDKRPVGVIAIRSPFTPLAPGLHYYGNSADVRIWAKQLTALAASLETEEAEYDAKHASVN